MRNGHIGHTKTEDAAVDPVRLSLALQSLYAAAIDPVARLSLPQKLAAVFDAPSCIIHMRTSAPFQVTVVGSTENLQPLMPAYAKDLHALDAWSEIATARKWGQACLGEDIILEADLLKSDWYHEICRPLDIHHIVGAVVEVDSATTGLIGIHRPSKGSYFAGEDRAAMDLLLPHLTQVLRLIRCAEESERTNRLTLDALATLSVGVMVLSGDGQVHVANAAAERLTKAGRPVGVVRNRLVLSDPKLNDRLRAAVHKVSLAPLGRSLCSGDRIVVPSGETSSITLMVVPLPPQMVSAGAPLAAVLLGDCPTGAMPSCDVITEVYGLTLAESRILLAVVEGERLAEYASRNRLSINTVQAQLKAVFAKTGCHRQVDLVRKVMADPMLRLSNAWHASQFS